MGYLEEYPNAIITNNLVNKWFITQMKVSYVVQADNNYSQSRRRIGSYPNFEYSQRYNGNPQAL